MNSKQFVNTVILVGIDKISNRLFFLNGFGKFITDLLFPRFMRIPIGNFWKKKTNSDIVIYAYVFVFIILFVVQAAWALVNGKYFPDQDNSTKMFTEDIENLINYILLCEAYCITGYFFLIQTYTVRRKLRRDGILIDLTDDNKIIKKGFISGIAIFIIALIGSAGYAVEIHNYTSNYWFMKSGPPKIELGYAGYYYLFINFILLLFIVWIGFAHFGLFHVAHDISDYLKKIIKSKNNEILTEWADDEISRRKLSSFAIYILNSKLMVFLIMLNMLTWKMNEKNVGVMYGIGVVITAVFGVWIFSLPRYSVQRHLFTIRRMVGKNTYPDVRDPWVHGFSTFLDVLLFSFVLNYLLNDAIGKLIEKFFSG